MEALGKSDFSLCGLCRRTQDYAGRLAEPFLHGADVDNLRVELTVGPVLDLRARGRECTRPAVGAILDEHFKRLRHRDNARAQWNGLAFQSPRIATSSTGTERKFHPDFDREEFHEHYDWEFVGDPHTSSDGREYYTFQTCPMCERDCKEAARRVSCLG